MKSGIILVVFFILSFVSNGQNFMIFNSTDKSSHIPNTYSYIFTPGGNNFTLDTSYTAPYIITASGVAPTNVAYINGIGVSNYTELGSVQPIQYNAINFNTDKFVINAYSQKNDSIRIRVMLKTTLYSGYGADFYLEGGDTFNEVSIDMNKFSFIDGASLDGINFLTETEALKILKVEFEIVKFGNKGTGFASVQFKDIYIGAPKYDTITTFPIPDTVTTIPNQDSTSIASTIIGKTAVYPNPIENMFTALVNLDTSAYVTIIISDMMGSVIRTEDFGIVTNFSKEIDMSGVAKGLYSITYLINGIPEKSEKIMLN